MARPVLEDSGFFDATGNSSIAAPNCGFQASYSNHIFYLEANASLFLYTEEYPNSWIIKVEYYLHEYDKYKLMLLKHMNHGIS